VARAKGGEGAFANSRPNSALSKDLRNTETNDAFFAPQSRPLLPVVSPLFSCTGEFLCQQHRSTSL
jgi:hypothetical protein